MPRSHGRILSAIWNDRDFLALDEGPQRLYLFLLSQPDLSHAGLVPLRERRWATKAANMSAGTVRDRLDILEAARFVVVDYDTEEVLIRTFVRNDGVYKQPKVMLRLREDARLVDSPKLRAAFRAELDHLPLHELTTTRQAVTSIVADLKADFADAGYPSERVSDTPGEPLPVDNPPDDAEIDVSAGQYPSERVSGRVSDTPRVRAGALPQPPSPFPQPPTPVPPTAGRGEPGTEVAVADEAPTAQTLIAEWIDHCAERPPGRVIGHVSKEIKTLLDEGIDPQRVRHALAEWNRKGLHPSTLASVVHETSRPQHTGYPEGFPINGTEAEKDAWVRAQPLPTDGAYYGGSRR